MKILLFGVSNVGKTTTARLLADRLGYKFFDLDDEIRRRYNTTIEEFVKHNLHWKDAQRCKVIKEIVKKNENIVFAISPITLAYLTRTLKSQNVLGIELYDTPENIFSRLVFSDENDNLYFDDDYKNENKDFYLDSIQEDLDWYSKRYKRLNLNKFFINNDSPSKVVQTQLQQSKMASNFDVYRVRCYFFLSNVAIHLKAFSIALIVFVWYNIDIL